MNLTVMQAAKALGNDIASEKLINRVSIDSRDVDENTLFFAIKGERFDGHDFIEDVAKKGVGAIVSHKEVSVDVPVIYVKDKGTKLTFTDNIKNESLHQTYSHHTPVNLGSSLLQEERACID